MEDGKQPEERQLFGSNIPLNIDFSQPRLSEEELKKFTRPDPAAKFHLKTEINFDYKEKQNESRYDANNMFSIL